MKKTVTLIILVTLCVQAAAQTKALQADESPFGIPAWEYARMTDRHVNFDDVALDGQTGEVLDKLKSRGWREISREKRKVILQGNWMGNTDTRIAVHHKNGKAYLVEAYPKATIEWETAKEQYDKARRSAVSWSGKTEEELKDCTDHNLNIEHRKKFRLEKVHRDFLDGNSAYHTAIPLYEGVIEIEILGKNHVMNPISKRRRGRFQTRAIYRDGI